MEPLTGAESRLFEIIQGLTDPTTGDIRRIANYTNSGVLYMLRRLERKGWVNRHQPFPGAMLHWSTNQTASDESQPSAGRGGYEETEAVIDEAQQIAFDLKVTQLVDTEVALHTLQGKYKAEAAPLEETVERLRAELRAMLRPAPVALVGVNGTAVTPTQSPKLNRVIEIIRANGALTMDAVTELYGEMNHHQMRGSIAHLVRHGLVRRREDGRYEVPA